MEGACGTAELTVDHFLPPRRRAAKKSVRRLAHGSAQTPAMISARWLSLASSAMVMSDRTAPALGSPHPYTTRRIRALTIAPAHIGQGSRVT